MSEKKPKIFISYSWEDKAVSRKLANCLRRDGAQVWIDYSENKAGDSFIKKMNSGLEWCDTFVLLWSKSAANSNFVSMEWEGALANNLKIIPCLIDKTKLPIILLGRIYKDLSNFDEGYNSLAKDLNLILEDVKPKREVNKVVKTSIVDEFKKPEVIEKNIEAKKEFSEKKKRKIIEEPKIIEKEKIEQKREVKPQPILLKKKWHKPIGIIVICVLLFIFAYIVFKDLIIPKLKLSESTLTEQMPIDTTQTKVHDTTLLNASNQKKPETGQSKRRDSPQKQHDTNLKSTTDTISITTFRKYPQELSRSDVKRMLKKYDFFCKEQDWIKEFCNPNGKGFDNDFVLQQNGQIVYDRKSDLMWQQSGSDNYMIYGDAKIWVEELDFAGYNDWRLPTLEEAMSLMEFEVTNGLYINPIFNNKQSFIWTADQAQDESPAAAWVVFFNNGDCLWQKVQYDVRLFDNCFVRAVRSGQSSHE